MELPQLRYFVSVAEEQSVTKAAESLRVSQPAVTRQIHKLEGEVGMRLFNRSKSGMELTEEGKCFLIDARRILALEAESVQNLQHLKRQKTDELEVAYSANFTFDLLPKIVETFSKAHPLVHLNLRKGKGVS